MWNDQRFTYLLSDAPEAPALYEEEEAFRRWWLDYRTACTWRGTWSGPLLQVGNAG